MTDTLAPVHALIAARALIADPVNWTKEVFARTSDGSAVTLDGPNATCFCAWGAVLRASFILETDTISVYDALQAQMPGPDRAYISIPDFNDAETTTHADVLALFDRTIAALTAEPVQ